MGADGMDDICSRFKVLPIEGIGGDDEEDTQLLIGMSTEARAYLESQEWCQGINASYWGLGVGGIVAVFLFQVDHDERCSDDYLWVVVGDLPSLYIVTDDAPDPLVALECYICEMNRWAEVAGKNHSGRCLAPVGVPANEKNITALKKRMDFLVQKIIPLYK